MNDNITFFSDTFDVSKQAYYNFSGKYIMRVIAGGYSRDSMVTYSVEEQHAFNIPGVSDVSLIWNVSLKNICSCSIKLKY